MDGVALPLQLPAHAHVRRHHAALRLLLALPIVLIGVLGVGLIRPTAHLRSLNAEGQQPLATALKVGFSWPVSRALDVQVTPHVEGQVVFEDALVQNRLVRTLVFVPDRTWQPSTTYILTLTDVESATHITSRASDVSLSFTTESLPALTSVLPKAESTIVADAAWVVGFDAPRSPSAAVAARLEPYVEFTQTWSADNTVLTLRPNQFLAQGKQYVLHITRAPQQLTFGTNEVAVLGEPQEIFQGSWSVREPPGITTITPGGTGVALDTSLTVSFAEPVDAVAFSAQVKLAPPLVGAWTSVDNKIFTMQPSDLHTATTYTLTIPSGLRTKSGGVLETDVRAQFRTVEPIALATTSPAAEAKGVRVNQTVRLTFNQPVQHEGVSAQLKFSPPVKGVWKWVGDELVFTPVLALAFGTPYTLTVAKALKPLQGLPALNNLTLRFTTEQAVTRLAVPFHRQDYKLSCEAATLVMALRYRGIDIGEQPIIDAIGFDPTPKKNGVWGDPDIAFVGDIDGQQPGTGYGVYAVPIAKAGSAYRPTRVLDGATLQDVLTQVQAGNPVIVWGNASTGQRVDWKTPTGKTVRAIAGEHTRVVIGFVGSVSNPSTIVTLDPLYGEKRFTRAAFLADWALLGNMAVVVE
ncbi:MAG: Ig-like domain-containing protein [bacterium]|nr:Ig-like domain-containing protein [bacterium]